MNTLTPNLPVYLFNVWRHTVSESWRQNMKTSASHLPVYLFNVRWHRHDVRWRRELQTFPLTRLLYLFNAWRHSVGVMTSDGQMTPQTVDRLDTLWVTWSRGWATHAHWRRNVTMQIYNTRLSNLHESQRPTVTNIYWTTNDRPTAVLDRHQFDHQCCHWCYCCCCCRCSLYVEMGRYTEIIAIYRRYPGLEKMTSQKRRFLKI